MSMETTDPLSALREIPGIDAAWVERVPDIAVDADRGEVMRRLRPAHESAVARLAAGRPHTWWRAEQVHGAEVAIVPGAPQIACADGLPVVPGVDGLVSKSDGSMLSIYVADCGAIWLADRRTRAIGLLHSGKKGTENNILQQAVDTMAAHFGSHPPDLTAILSPCIRPPDYEVDFAAQIARQAQRAGIGNFIDSGHNTACDLSRYYSYRKESGKTGRMMALLYRSTVS
jgi:copper oxidase (laccase) domain-containing protein